ncbi:LysR family transcriptional regulator [Acinetobacter nectaris]|uniref:LysR family transcriptional regulator n=1 Tax=Acinetobacter nectaris TaxID=1219382 RepID=UPI001F37FB37|nr:LysR family transcriptional regulator [Acinetobacter nectaris]MCF9000185.1 LysR family transcriptional regulator [Acinetobacter nectaris]MCF9028343.1 LysR family transcriptional regulator [Acinetobacter nectaris]
MRYFDTTLLSTFVTVAHSKTITSASSKLHLSNSTISEQLSKLEDFVGKKLMIRNRQGTSLTVEGELLLTEAENILMSCSTTLNKIRGIDISGEFRIAITDYFRPNDLSTILRRIKKKFPQLKLHISILKSDEIKERDITDKYDLAIYMDIEEKNKTNNDIKIIKLSEEPLFWVKSPELSITNSPIPLITMSSSCILKSFTEDSLVKSKLPFYFSHTTTGVRGIIAAVEAGLGISCLNQSSLNSSFEIINIESDLNLPKLTNIQFMLCLSPRQSITTSSISKILINEFS